VDPEHAGGDIHGDDEEADHHRFDSRHRLIPWTSVLPSSCRYVECGEAVIWARQAWLSLLDECAAKML
jgi:hypothetical protein